MRLQNYDYSRSGAYYVTVCTHNRVNLFGQVMEGTMRLNSAGEMLWAIWNCLEERFPGIDLDVFIVMPNHVHGVIVLDGSSATTVGSMVGAYKSLAVQEYAAGVRDAGWPRYNKQLWQRNYYEHVIRDERELASVREYIVYNAAKWDTDPENGLRLQDGGS
jgi:putative transposase